MSPSVPEPNFDALVELLSGQAMLAMGTPLPGLEEQPPANPQAARFFVDLLVVLQERTEGHRNEAETRHLEELLYHLRMRALDLQAHSPAGSPGQQGA